MDRKSSKELVERALATSEDLKNNKENEDNSANLGTPASTFYGASSKTRHSFSSPVGSYSRRRLSDLQSRPELSDWQEWTKTSSLFQSPSPPRTSRSRLLDTNFKSPPSRTHPEPPRKPFAARQKVPEIRPYSSRTLNGVPTTSSPKRPSLPDTTSKVKPLVPSYKDPHRIGFPNAGLTCYVNAVLQSLLGHPSFFNDVLKMDISKDDDDDPGLVQLLINVAKLKNLGHQENVNEAIGLFRKKLDKALPQFHRNRMQDAHEFLVSFCDHSQTELTNGNLTSPIEENFAFKLEETRTCCRCNHATKLPKDDLCLRLDMPESSTVNNAFTLQALVEKTLNGSGMELRCSKCGDKSAANVHESRDVFSRLPRVLILYLPRSQYLKTAQEFQKNRAHVCVNVVISLAGHVTCDVDRSKLSTPGVLPPKRNRKRKSSSSLCLLDGILDGSLAETLPKKATLTFDELSKMSDEEQLKYAVEQSLNESKMSYEAEEELMLTKALEESMHETASEELPSNDLKIVGKMEATEEFDYKLTASITHVNSISSVESGHYVADVFSVPNNQWFHYDDMSVTSRSVERVIQQSNLDGCLLFYTHRNIVDYFAEQ